MLRYRIRLVHVYRTEYRNSFFLEGLGGRLFEGGRLLQILNLRRGANSKRGTYLKLGANSSIYGIRNYSNAALLISDLYRCNHYKTKWNIRK